MLALEFSITLGKTAMWNDRKARTEQSERSVKNIFQKRIKSARFKLLDQQ